VVAGGRVVAFDGQPPVADGGQDVTVWLSYPGPEVSQARARIAPRSAAWRRTAALKQLLWWLLIPVVVWAPPHFLWVIIVLAIGGVLAVNRLREEATLLSLHGPCPKCGTEQAFTDLGRLKYPHKLHCGACRWELRLELTRPRHADG
jgi:hypothetical protein